MLDLTCAMGCLTPQPPLPTQAIVQTVLRRWPEALGIYAFGSRVTGQAGPQSDADLAVLVPGYADPLELWDVASELMDTLHCPVDLLDFRMASAVMQYQVLTTGVRLWAKDVRASLFEAFVLSEKTNLDEARAGLMADIARRGSVCAR